MTEDCKMENPDLESAGSKRITTDGIENNDLAEAKRMKKTIAEEDLDLLVSEEAETLISDGQKPYAGINNQPVQMVWSHEWEDAEDDERQNVVDSTNLDLTVSIEESSKKCADDHHRIYTAVIDLIIESEKQAEIPLEKFLKDLGLEEYLEKLEAQNVGVTAMKSFTCENLKALKLPVGARNTLRYALKCLVLGMSCYMLEKV